MSWNDLICGLRGYMPQQTSCIVNCGYIKLCKNSPNTIRVNSRGLSVDISCRHKECLDDLLMLLSIDTNINNIRLPSGLDLDDYQVLRDLVVKHSGKIDSVPDLIWFMERSHDKTDYELFESTAKEVRSRSCSSIIESYRPLVDDMNKKMDMSIEW